MHFGLDGGAERFFVNLAQALDQAGVEQRFIIRPGRIWKAGIESSGEIIENHFRRLSISGQLLPNRVRRLARQWKPTAMMSWMPRASRLMPEYPDAIRLARLGDYPSHLRHFRHVDILVANAPGIAQHCRELGWTKPLIVISNFVRNVEVQPVPRATYDTPRDAFIVGASGRLVQRKGFDAILRAVAAMPDAWIWIAGTGARERDLRQLAENLGMTRRTKFLGWLNEPAHAMASTDVYLMASRNEPLGNVVLEAWHAGVPVISSRSQGPLWFTTNGKDALLVDIDSVEQMTEALLRLRSNPDLAARLINGGRKTLRTRFSRDSIVQQYLSVFRGNTEHHESLGS
ncbi:MAG: glycosyltransferase [Rhodobacteraceae bacterium]|nr:glycosyltransferase [Paracoccaceae bacterium]